MKRVCQIKLVRLIGLIGLILTVPDAMSATDGDVRPTAVQRAWQEAEVGALFSYDLHVFDGKHYNQKLNRIHAMKDVNIFNPTQLDTDQWLQAAKDMGARFAILTASHETGFRLWQSDVNPYCLKAVKWGGGKRDIVAEFIASCKKYDIKPGIYLGTRWNSQLGVWDFKVTKNSKITQQTYNQMIEKEVEEICSRYGPLFEVWFDGGAHGPKQGGPDVLGVFEKYQKNCLFYHNLERADARWGGSESGTVPYPCWSTFPFKATGAGDSAKKEIHKNNFALLKHGDPDGKYWMPAMSDAPLRGYKGHEWFWEPGDDHKVYPLKNLVDMYYGSVGHNSTLIVGLTPDDRGLIPEADAKRCKEWGQAIGTIFSNEIAKTSGRGNRLELTLPAKTSFDHFVLQEDIRQGERVRQFTVEYKTDGKWHELNTGSCIGHKRILKFKPVIADKVRLTIGKSIAEPIIKKFTVYDSSRPKQKTSSEYFVSGSGLKNSQIRFVKDRKGTVAFLGGSITKMSGWRELTYELLEKRFPETKFTFIDAGIPSVDSTGDAFRLERDVLSKGKVDLLFVEASVNDFHNQRGKTERIRAMEGIIRHTWNVSPKTDIVFMCFVDKPFVDMYTAGKTPQVIADHLKVASHYNIPSINMAKEVTDRINAGEFKWEKFRNCHPSPFGHQLYADSIDRLFSSAWSKPVSKNDTPKPHILAKTLDKLSYQGGRLIDIKNAEIVKGFRLVKSWKPTKKAGTREGFVNVPMLVAENPGAELKFKFKGTAAGMFIIAGPDAGIIEASIDGGSVKTIDLFTRWSRRLHLPWMLMTHTELGNCEHVLTIKTTSGKNPASKGNAIRIVHFATSAIESAGDLVTPVMTDGKPAAGRRVRQVAIEYKGTEVYHSLYLPVDWKAGGKYPVIVEYTGNKAGFCNSTGEVKDANLGYGISGGKGFIWVCMPYVEKGGKENAVTWWGDRQATVDYCKVNLPRICKEFGGDPDNVFICGFSRGAIGASYIGLADDEIASIWKGMFTHDHFDGQIEKWGYPGCDRKSALKRLSRLKGRPVLVCGGGADYLKDHLGLAEFTFLNVSVEKIFDIPEGKVIDRHTDMWMHRESNYRKTARKWLEKVGGKRFE